VKLWSIGKLSSTNFGSLWSNLFRDCVRHAPIKVRRLSQILQQNMKIDMNDKNDVTISKAIFITIVKNIFISLEHSLLPPCDLVVYVIS
jgi:hypothetical protein